MLIDNRKLFQVENIKIIFYYNLTQVEIFLILNCLYYNFPCIEFLMTEENNNTHILINFGTCITHNFISVFKCTKY